ncbi:MAG: hypothetical protein WAU32_18140 [Thermoanaerobaculia bacterium]
MRIAAPLLLVFLALSDAAIRAPAQMRLKNGTVYQLQEPPLLKDGRFVFTTAKGEHYSLSEREVAEVRLLAPPSSSRAAPNPQDSRQLGAIARQQRRRKGRYTAVAPRPAPRSTQDAP